MLAAVHPWQWKPHPEVWALLVGIVALGFYATRVIGPKVVARGEPVVTRKHKLCFTAAVLLLWIAADWPMHDIGEDYLYSVHMVQHLIISFVIPPLFLMATPTWLARLVLLEDGFVSRQLRRLARPIPAAVLFNAVTVFLHWQTAVTESVKNGPFHYSMHLLLFASALLMWIPVAGPLPELRISLPAQMIYLFLQSVIPTIPGGWLALADKPVYKIYDRPYRLWHVSVLSDQQAAGVIMKLLGGFYLWAIITVLFFKWASRQEKLNERESMRPVVRQAPPAVVLDDDLTFESVSAEFERLGPAPPEPVPRGPNDADPSAN
jgi:putative membrane protein